MRPAITHFWLPVNFALGGFGFDTTMWPASARLSVSRQRLRREYSVRRHGDSLRCVAGQVCRYQNLGGDSPTHVADRPSARDRRASPDGGQSLDRPGPKRSAPPPARRIYCTMRLTRRQVATAKRLCYFCSFGPKYPVASAIGMTCGWSTSYVRPRVTTVAFSLARTFFIQSVRSP
jgi:hypothetical protein